MRRLALALWLLACVAWGQGIDITKPAKPIAPGGFVLIPYKGLTEEEAKLATFTVTPADGVIVGPFAPGVRLVLVLDGAAPGKRELVIGLHLWKRSLNQAAADAKLANAPAAVIADLDAALKKAEPFILKSGSAVLEVAGTVPFPPVDPLDPNQPPVDPNHPRINRVTYVYEKDQNSVPRPVSLALQRLNVEASFGGVIATEFEEDTVDGFGQVPDQYTVALKAAREAGLPALVVQAGATVVRVVKAPKTEAEVIGAVK